MKIGYIRVSTEEQNTARQEVLLRELDVDELFIDKASGKNADRPELTRMMNYVRRGDTVIVESISRFARNTRDLLDLVERLTEKHVEFVSRKEAIDTTTPTGKFMLTVFAAVAELEREYILQRQREGIAIAKEQGKYTDRKPRPLPDNFERVVARCVPGKSLPQKPCGKPVSSQILSIVGALKSLLRPNGGNPYNASTSKRYRTSADISACARQMLYWNFTESAIDNPAVHQSRIQQKLVRL